MPQVKEDPEKPEQNSNLGDLSVNNCIKSDLGDAGSTAGD